MRGGGECGENVVVREEGRLPGQERGKSAKKVGARTRACSCEQGWRGSLIFASFIRRIVVEHS